MQHKDWLMQKEIISKTQLHDSRGHLYAPGFAKRMLFEYDRNKIKAGPFSLKEWDFYQIVMGDYIVQITIGHVSYIASFSAKLISLKTGDTKEFTRLKPLPLRGLNMPLNPETPNTLKVKGSDYSICFSTKESIKTIEVNAKDETAGKVDIFIEIDNNPLNEKMVIATPFEKKNQFYLNFKENYYSVRGRVKFDDITLTANDTDTALLDWGRGVWPFKHEWFWGNGSKVTDKGTFGFNIGWGFGDLSNATENMFFWNGKAYKLGKLVVERDTSDYMAPWKFRDESGIFAFVMTPIYDNFTSTEIAFVRTQCHQVFGKYNGTVTLPDGKKIIINDMLSFCEHAENRW